MKDTIIVLRRGTDRGAARGPSFQASSRPEIRVEVESLERRELKRVLRHADVEAVAPAMPMRLIEPREVRLAAPEEQGGIAWGVSAVKADTSPFTGAGVTVAVLDTGIDASHPAFDGVELVHRNFTGEGEADTHGHGTHCAGTIFGRDVSGLRIGVAPGVTRALIGKVLGSGGGSSEQIVEAIRWAAENGANVISMSLGIDFPGYSRFLREQAGMPEELAVSRALEGYRANVMLFERLASLIRAQSLPLLIVAAAGNESQRDVDPDFEIAVSPPAVSEGIVSVAALGQGPGGFQVARFSNTGATVSGPGVGVVSAGLSGGLQTMSGTSMATPHVAGVAALWAERIRSKGALSAQALNAMLVASGSFDDLGPDFDPFDVGTGMVCAPRD